MKWGSVFRWALVSRNYAGAEPVTGLKCTHRSCCTRTHSWRCRISPPAPWDSRHHWPQNTSRNWTRSLACIKPTWTFLKYLAQIFCPSSQSLRSDYPAICFYCLLLTSQSLLLLSTFCVALQRSGWRDYCLRLGPSQWLCCASSYQILLWTRNLMKFSLFLCCLAFQLFLLNFQRVQKLK